MLKITREMVPPKKLKMMLMAAPNWHSVVETVATIVPIGRERTVQHGGFIAGAVGGALQDRCRCRSGDGAVTLPARKVQLAAHHPSASVAQIAAIITDRAPSTVAKDLEAATSPA